MLEKIKATASFIKKRFNSNPEIGIILGTGLGGLVDEVEIVDYIPYREIPDFPVSTVDGHAGRLIHARMGNKEIIALQGRFHFYEGYTMQEVVFPVRVMKFLGITDLIVSNASGGLNPDWRVGDIVLITDHINFFPEHPLYGENFEELGPRFPDMSRVYDERLRNKAKLIALEYNIPVKEGVYVGVQGPTYETPAEYKMFRILGGDIVGMSTIPEVIAARHMGLRIFGISIITDSGVPGEIVEIFHDEVQKVAMKAEPKMTLIMQKLIESI
jgi:purine-nucleoside phosphorylase